MATAPDFVAPGFLAREGASRTFDVVLERARPRLLRYALRRLADPHEAEEVVQEALLRGYQHRTTFDTEDDLMAWLTVVTGRLAIDRLRVRGRTVAVAELPPTARTSRDTAEVVVARSEARIALDALEAMPGRQAAVLWAREVEGLSYDAIAERYALSEPTVRSLLHRARRSLRREYSARGGTVPAGGLVVLAPWQRGLHVLARLRDLGRRAGAASTTAATGLAVVGVLAIGSAPVPSVARIATPPAGQAQVVTASAPRAFAAARPSARGTRAPRRAAGVVPAPQTHHTWKTPVTPLCGARVEVDCTTHTASTVYLRPTLPANPLGWNQAGVSDDLIDCRLVPDTALTQCASGADTTATGGRP